MSSKANKTYILAARGEQLTGEKFQKYLMSFEEDGSYSGNLKWGYMTFNTAMVFNSLEEALEMVGFLCNKEHWGWYPLVQGRDNEGGI